MTNIASCDFANFLDIRFVMDRGIRPLWNGAPRLVGPAYTVSCPAGDNLMAHAAIYRAPTGSVVVIQGGDDRFAMAGGNVCATAQRNGIAGFVVDGLIRDEVEIVEAGFPVYCRGRGPKAGAKGEIGTLGEKIHCGGVEVHTGDIVCADEDGVVIVPAADYAEVERKALERLDKESRQTLDEWAAAHRTKIDALLSERGYVG